ncbi:glycosyl hydrolase family 28-related protein [Streptomyces sp. B6B3]|uniref:glycosyl hydrolase family 28-related protein n=1 Tax=Streptomyces sp. B6B3 TaxID=3153570 RepID=UPI00325C3D6A
MATAVVAVDVAVGDVLCSARDPLEPEKLTKAVPAALAAGTTVTGVAAQPAVAGTAVTYFAAGERVPAATSGLPAGPACTVVVDASARAVRQVPLQEDSWTVGTCDALGVLTVAARHGLANVLDFGARADARTDDWVAITAAIASLMGTTGTGTVYFPPGFYNIGRPLLVSGLPGIELRGESRETSVIRFNTGDHGPALCVCPAEVGPLPTGEALLSGPGRAGALDPGRLDTLDLRDSAALDLDGLGAFSVECTVRVDGTPAGTMAVISSSGRRNARDPQHHAFTLFLVTVAGAAALTLSATVTVGGREATLRLPGAVPVGVTTHLALTYDGDRLRLFAGAPGTTTVMKETADGEAGGPLTQAVEEGVYLGLYSAASWPEYHPVRRAFPGRIDSLRISARATRTAPFTAPTAKFPTDNASNGDTRLLVNFDRDVDVFTVGYTWYGRPPGAAPVLVYLPHHFDGIPSYATPAVRDLGFQSPQGTGVYGQLAPAVLDRVKVSAARDGIRFRGQSYLAEFEHVDVAADRLGLQLSGNTALVNVKRFQCRGAQYDFVATGDIGIFARDWYIGNQRSIVPVLLTSSASYGSFHGVSIAISSENVPLVPPEERRWQAAVMTSLLSHLVLESCTLDTNRSDTTRCPCVIIDSSHNSLGGADNFHSNYTFVNCDFWSSPDATSVFVLSGETVPHPVRIIGGRKSRPAAAPAPIPWTLPHQAPLVSFVGGAVSTTDAGLTQWQGTRDWVFAYDTSTGLVQAAERETQTTGSITAGGGTDLCTLPLGAGATILRAEVALADTGGRAARWILEQGFTRTGTGTGTGPGAAVPWAAAARLLDAFGSASGAPPADWPAPTLVASDASADTAVVRWTAPAGQRLAFTVRLRTLDALVP